MIEFEPRYSSTNKPDKFGRWSRIAYFKNIQIAVIKKFVNDDGSEVFFVNTHFPTLKNDSPHEVYKTFTYENAKYWLQEKWKWFLNQTKTENYIPFNEAATIIKNTASIDQAKQIFKSKLTKQPITISIKGNIKLIID
jgi:hypothetical protein